MTEYNDIDDLIERSSLGTPAARALRALTPRWVAAEIVRRAAQLEARSCPSSPVPSAEFELCVQAADELLAQLECRHVRGPDGSRFYGSARAAGPAREREQQQQRSQVKE